VGPLAVTIFKAGTLGMPLVASDQVLIVEFWGCCDDVQGDDFPIVFFSSNLE